METGEKKKKRGMRKEGRKTFPTWRNRKGGQEIFNSDKESDWKVEILNFCKQWNGNDQIQKSSEGNGAKTGSCVCLIWLTDVGCSRYSRYSRNPEWKWPEAVGGCVLCVSGKPIRTNLSTELVSKCVYDVVWLLLGRRRHSNFCIPK